MNWLDVVNVAVIAAVVALEYKRKFVQGAFAGVCAWVGLQYALENYQTMAPKLGKYVAALGTPSGAFAALFWGIFLAGVAGGLIIYFTTRIEPAGPVEPVLGALFGLISGVQILRFFFVSQVMFHPKGDFQTKVAANSATYEFIYNLPFLGDFANATKGLREPDQIKGSGGL